MRQLKINVCTLLVNYMEQLLTLSTEYLFIIIEFSILDIIWENIKNYLNLTCQTKGTLFKLLDVKIV